MKFKCPKCGATPNQHGKGGEDACKRNYGGGSCSGFICECDQNVPESDEQDHGESASNPCPNATCNHCGWFGTFPVPKFDPKKLKGWAKSAWAAGWRPPERMDTMTVNIDYCLAKLCEGIEIIAERDTLKDKLQRAYESRDGTLQQLEAKIRELAQAYKHAAGARDAQARAREAAEEKVQLEAQIAKMRDMYVDGAELEQWKSAHLCAVQERDAAKADLAKRKEEDIKKYIREEIKNLEGLFYEKEHLRFLFDKEAKGITNLNVRWRFAELRTQNSRLTTEIERLSKRVDTSRPLRSLATLLETGERMYFHEREELERILKAVADRLTEMGPVVVRFAV